MERNQEIKTRRKFHSHTNMVRLQSAVSIQFINKSKNTTFTYTTYCYIYICIVFIALYVQCFCDTSVYQRGRTAQCQYSYYSTSPISSTREKKYLYHGHLNILLLLDFVVSPQVKSSYACMEFWLLALSFIAPMVSTRGNSFTIHVLYILGWNLL